MDMFYQKFFKVANLLVKRAVGRAYQCVKAFEPAQLIVYNHEQQAGKGFEIPAQFSSGACQKLVQTRQSFGVIGAAEVKDNAVVAQRSDTRYAEMFIILCSFSGDMVLSQASSESEFRQYTPRSRVNRP